LLLAQRLWEGREDAAEAWNFGPAEEGNVAVEDVVRRLQRAWPAIRYEVTPDPCGPRETHTLKLDSSKARRCLDWQPVWHWTEAVDRTAKWYQQYYDRGEVATQADLERYVADAQRQQCCWSR